MRINLIPIEFVTPDSVRAKAAHARTAAHPNPPASARDLYDNRPNLASCQTKLPRKSFGNAIEARLETANSDD